MIAGGDAAELRSVSADATPTAALPLHWGEHTPARSLQLPQPGRVAALRMKRETLSWSNRSRSRQFLSDSTAQSARAAVCGQPKLAYYVSADKTVTQSTDMSPSVTSLSCEAPALRPDAACRRAREQKHESCVAGIFRPIRGFSCSPQPRWYWAACCSLTGSLPGGRGSYHRWWDGCDLLTKHLMNY